MNVNEMKEKLYDEGYELTDCADCAIYVMADGSMIDGCFDWGVRGYDHRMIDFLVPVDIYEDFEGFWNYVHENLGLLRVVPETNICLALVNQELTDEQMEFIEMTGFELERY